MVLQKQRRFLVELINLELTLNQSLMLEQTKRHVHEWKREEVEKLLIDVMQLYFANKNAVSQLVTQVIKLETEGVLNNVKPQ